MNTAYSTFTGMKKRASLPYGMTAKRAAKLLAAGQDAEANRKQSFENLFTFAGIFIQHARDLAKSGHKDSARNWYRFFNNSQIVKILGELGVSGDLEQLREDLNYLGLECHPMDAPSFETDIQAIRACLTEILNHVKKSPSPALSSVNRGRSRNRQSSDGKHVATNFERH